MSVARWRQMIVSGARIGALLFAAAGSAAHASPPDADLAIIGSRLRVKSCATAPPLATVEQHRTRLRSDGSWPDIDYASTARASWPPYAHVTRLRDLAKAYACSTSPRRGDPRIQAEVGRAYEFWTARDPRSDNWWYNDIGAPEMLAHTMLLVEPMLSGGRREAGLTVLKRAYRPRDSTDSNTGANRVWRAGISIARGIIARDDALTDEAFRAVEDTIVVGTGEGVQADGSFHQHGPQLYNMGYGLTFAEDSLKWGAVAAGTRYAMQPRSLNIVTDFLLDGSQWLLRGGTAEPTARGREIVRADAGNKAERLLGALLDASAVGRHRAAELGRFAARLRASLESGRAEERLALHGHRHFWRSDVTAHHRPGYYVSVKISSPRTRQPETGNGENLKGLHLADGVNLIMRSGNEYAEIQPVWDWNRLPGTTTIQDAATLTPASYWGVAGTSDFAAGVAHGGHGATAFHYNRPGISARKAWFFFDNAMVALGAGIDAPQATGAVTTSVNQTLLEGPVRYKFRSEGASRLLERTAAPVAGPIEWVTHGGVGYLFLGPTTNGSLAARPQTGSWSLINRAASPAAITRDVFSLTIDHGARPAGGSYAYLVIPDAGPVDISGVRASPPIVVVRNDAGIQAVRDRARNRYQIVFHAPGTVELAPGLAIAADRPGVVMLHRAGAALDISAAVPNSDAVNLELRTTLPLVGLDADTRGLTTIRLPMPTGGLAGSTVTRRFQVGRLGSTLGSGPVQRAGDGIRHAHHATQPRARHPGEEGVVPAWSVKSLMFFSFRTCPI